MQKARKILLVERQRIDSNQTSSFFQKYNLEPTQLYEQKEVNNMPDRLHKTVASQTECNKTSRTAWTKTKPCTPYALI